MISNNEKDDKGLRIFSGVILVTGEHGTGKTRFALESGDITKTILIDDDLKGRATKDRIANDLKQYDIQIGQYIDFIEETQGKKSLAIYQAGMAVIDAIPENTFDVLVWDTWTRFESSIVAYIKANMGDFTPPNGWASNGQIKTGEMYKAAKLYEAEIIAKMQKKVPLIILVSHLKNQYINNAPTGKQIPAVSAAVDRVTNMRFWIRHNPTSATPVALVLKNTEKNKLDEHGRLRPVKVFPTKITPRENDRSLWDTLIYYFDNPIGHRKPTSEETPDDYERTIVEGTLTEDQRLTWLFAIKQQQELEKEMTAMQEAEMKKRAIALKEDGKALPQIANVLSKEFDKQVVVKDVIKLIS